jgi:hypothetical protein
LLRRQATNHQFSDPSLTASPELTNWPQRTLVLERNGTDADGNQITHSEKIGSLTPIGEEEVHDHDLNPVKIRTVKHPSRNRVKRAVS